MAGFESLVGEAKLAILAFGAALSWNLVLWSMWLENVFLQSLSAILALIAQLLLFQKNSNFPVVWRSYILGMLFSAGINIILFASRLYTTLGLFFCVLSFFHMSEYLATALHNPSSLKLDSFIINHSWEYNLALVISIVEHLVWVYFIPGMKMPSFFTLLGLSLCMFGEVFRKLAMFTAGKSFNHVVQFYKRHDHVLVTSGVYGIVRHPSYTGWFCWSIGTQILLCNPVSFVGYALASWKFFNDRIIYEEMTLLNFFGRDYLNYKKSVPSGIPFVKGYVL